MFYSQTLTKIHIDNTCARCEAKFPNWSAYHLHATTAQCVKVIKPVKVTGRSKTQIVSDWESKHKENIIG